MKRTMGWAVIATLLAGSAGAASAESIRYIHQPLDGNRNPAFDFQSHATQTPFVANGGSITISRVFGSSVFAYKHGLDLTPVTVVAGPGVTLTELIRVNGIQSHVFTPSVVGGVSAKTGAIGYRVTLSRDLPVGTRRTVELRYPAGDKNTFVIVVGGCPANLLDGLAALTSGTLGDNALAANQSTDLRLDADRPAMCGGQPLVVNAPACFKIADRPDAQHASSLSLTWRDSDPPARTLRLRADADCPEANRRGEVTASLSGVALTRRPVVTWVPGLVLPRDRIQQKPGLPELPPPVKVPSPGKPSPGQKP